MRSVAFNTRMDVYEFCSDSLKKSLDQGRLFEEKMLEEKEKARNEAASQDVDMEESKSENKP